MKCNYCENENAIEIVERLGPGVFSDPIDSMCGNCYERAVVQAARALEQAYPLFDTSQPVDHEKMSQLVETMHPRPRLEI